MILGFPLVLSICCIRALKQSSTFTDTRADVSTNMRFFLPVTNVCTSLRYCSTHSSHFVAAMIMGFFALEIWEWRLWTISSGRRISYCILCLHLNTIQSHRCSACHQASASDQNPVPTQAGLCKCTSASQQTEASYLQPFSCKAAGLCSDEARRFGHQWTQSAQWPGFDTRGHRLLDVTLHPSIRNDRYSPRALQSQLCSTQKCAPSSSSLHWGADIGCIGRIYLRRSCPSLSQCLRVRRHW